MVFELSPGTQIPFMFLGGALVAGVVLLNDSVPDLFTTDTYRKFSIGFNWSINDDSIDCNLHWHHN